MEATVAVFELAQDRFIFVGKTTLGRADNRWFASNKRFINNFVLTGRTISQKGFFFEKMSGENNVIIWYLKV